MLRASEGSPGILLDRVPPALRKPRFPGAQRREEKRREEKRREEKRRENIFEVAPSRGSWDGLRWIPLEKLVCLLKKSQ